MLVGVLDVSQVMGTQPRRQARHHHGAEVALFATDTLRASLTLHPRGQDIAEHAHDWPSLTLYLIGSYDEQSEVGQRGIRGPAAVLHGSGGAHRDVVGSDGLETVVLGFEPSWFNRALGGRPAGPLYCQGGAVGRRASWLARAWLRPSPARQGLLSATLDFLRAALREPTARPREPGWLGAAREMIVETPPNALSTSDLAQRLRLHPGWLTQAYRAYEGEGLQEAGRRRRVEHAVQLLRSSSMGLAQIALEAGFCDQSHMNRVFSAVLVRSPAQVRRERLLFENSPEPQAP